MKKKTEEFLETTTNRYEEVLNDDLLNLVPRSVLWAIVVRLLRNAGYEFHQIDQAVVDTWKQLWAEHFVRREPPESSPLAISWWDPQSERAVGYASNIWGCDRGLAWEVIDTAVRAELIPATMGETEFKAWADIKLHQWESFEAAKRKREAEPLLLMHGVGNGKRLIKKLLDKIDDE